MTPRPFVRLRVILGAETAIGPGKADLLEAIGKHGSIAAAGRAMNMSYQRAWSLVDELNHNFRTPLVAVSRGGSQRGGATLTPTGLRVLEGYRSIERTVAAHCQAELDELATLT